MKDRIALLVNKPSSLEEGKALLNAEDKFILTEEGKFIGVRLIRCNIQIVRGMRERHPEVWVSKVLGLNARNKEYLQKEAGKRYDSMVMDIMKNKEIHDQLKEKVDNRWIHAVVREKGGYSWFEAKEDAFLDPVGGKLGPLKEGEYRVYKTPQGAEKFLQFLKEHGEIDDFDLDAKDSEIINY